MHKLLILAHCRFFMHGWPTNFFHFFSNQNKFHQFYLHLGSTMEDDTILDSNDTIALDDCPPRTPDFVYNFTFWVEGIIQVLFAMHRYSNPLNSVRDCPKKVLHCTKLHYSRLLPSNKWSKNFQNLHYCKLNYTIQDY